MQNTHFDLFNAIINNVHFEILSHGHLMADSTWKNYNVNSSFNRLYFIINGEGYVENEHHRIDLLPGNTYLIPLNTTYDYICNSNMEKFYIHFKLELFPGHDLFQDLKFCVSKPFNRDCIEQLLNKARGNNIIEMLSCKTFLMDTIIEFFDSVTLQSIDKDMHIAVKYKKLYDYLTSHCSLNTTIEQIANHMHMSPAAISKSFKKDSGNTIKEFICKLLIQKAKENLILTTKNIKEIANELEFKDEFYFSRFFKKHTGVPPSIYRKQKM